jgi:cytochrome c-type protein NapC
VHLPALSVIAIVCASASALICVGYLVVRPALNHATKLWLLLGLGVFPIGLAMAGNVQGYEATKSREFCGSCHVMGPHKEDSQNLASVSLASRHARNKLFGDENCYACHRDYGMFGTITTKIGGARHVWLYFTEYHSTPIEEAKKTIKLRKPFSNDNCMQCHSTTLELWGRTPDHKASLEDVRKNRVSCASGGCHGFAHPFWKTPEELETSSAGAKNARGGANAAPPAPMRGPGADQLVDGGGL